MKQFHKNLDDLKHFKHIKIIKKWINLGNLLYLSLKQFKFTEPPWMRNLIILIFNSNVV